MKSLYLLAAAGAAIVASPATAATMFAFDSANSFVNVASQKNWCWGCGVSASLSSLPAFTLNNVGDRFTFDFADFVVRPGWGMGKSSIDAQLALLDPFSVTIGTGSTGQYLRLGGLFTPGVTAGTVTWANPTQVVSAGDGTRLSVTFGDIDGIGLGGRATSRVTVELLSSAVPEPATWAMMILGFGLTGYAMRRRKVNTTVRFA